MPDAVSLSPEALELKRRGRRRLLGAVTIALVLVVFVPMILDSEPRKAGKDIALTIPAKEGQPALPAPSAAPAKPETKSPGEPVKAESKPAEGAPPAAAAPPAVPALKPDASAAVKSEIAPVPVASPPTAKTETKVADVKPVEAKSDANPAPKAADTKAAAVKAADPKPVAKTDAKPAAKAEVKAEPKKEGFVVQLGAFSDADKVKQLTAKLKAAKIPVYTEQIKGDAGNLTRVRAGPYKTRELAEKAVPQVKKAGGENGKVVPL